MANWWEQWDPDTVTIDQEVPSDAWKTCVLQGVYFGDNEYNGSLGGRVSAIFVIMITSVSATMFPIVAKRIKSLRIPDMVYVLVRMFGSGVIIATAFIHLLDPAYSEIGGQSCVGSTGHWADYSWCPAIMLASAVVTFIVDAYCDFFADIWYGVHSHMGLEARHADDHGPHIQANPENVIDDSSVNEKKLDLEATETNTSEVDIYGYYSQFAGFLVLEFGVLFHSVMIGLTLGSSDEYSTSYPVLVFHQSFEGLGIGARSANIPFPKGKGWIPWVCCVAYGSTTPIAIAIGLGVRESYRDSSFTAQVVQGVLDAMSAGILLYTGFVELLARDFIFNPHRTKKCWYLSSQLFVFLWGAGLMALLGKWA